MASQSWVTRGIPGRDSEPSWGASRATSHRALGKAPLEEGSYYASGTSASVYGGHCQGATLARERILLENCFTSALPASSHSRGRRQFEERVAGGGGQEGDCLLR